MCKTSSFLHRVKKLCDHFAKMPYLKLVICLHVSAKDTSGNPSKNLCVSVTLPNTHDKSMWPKLHVPICSNTQQYDHLIKRNKVKLERSQFEGFIAGPSSWMKSITAFALAVPQKLLSSCIFNKNQTPNSERRSIIWNGLTTDQELHSPLHYH